MKRKTNKGVPNQRLHEARLQRQWSQQEVADYIGATANTVSRWELGVVTPGPYFRAKLSELFGKSAQELGFIPAQNSQRSQPPQLTPASNLEPAQSSAKQPDLLWSVPYPRNPHFIGREEVLHQLAQNVCTSPAKVQAITGLPGVGKTSLVIALAHDQQIREQFGDGVLWIDLGPTPALAETMNAWATALGLTAAEAQTLTTPDALPRWLHQHLRERRMLFILDDAWKVSDVVAFQVGGNQCRYVVTTRSPLLAYTIAPSSVTSLPPLSIAESQQLLHHLAPLASQHYPDELDALIQPCGGLPLALTLLGRFVHTRSLYSSSRRLLRTLQQLQQDMQTRFHITEPGTLEDTQSNLSPGTERSLSVAIDLSFQQLLPLAQRALSSLSVVAPTPQSFSEEAALAICDVSADTFDILVDSGLVEVYQDDRYRVHQTILDYTRLQEPDPVVEERFLTFIVSFVTIHAQDFHALNQDLPLITNAFERAFTGQRYDLLLRGILALQPFVEQRRLYTLAQTLLEWGEQAARATQDREGLARIWLFRGNMSELHGEAMQAQHAYFEGLALARELHQRPLLAELLVLVGGTLSDTGVSSQAEQYLLEGLRALKDFEDDASLSRAFQYLGELADTLGKNAEALAFYTRGLAIAHQTQNKKAVSALLQNLGVQAVRYDRYDQATAYYNEALTYARELGDLQRQSALLMNLGILAWYELRPDEAIKLSHESLRLAREIDHQMRIGSVLQNLGLMLRHQNQLEQAEHCLQESLDIARQIGHRWLLAETLGEMGFLLLKQQRIDKAKEIFAEMHQHAQAIQTPMLLGQALFGCAQIAEQEGQRSQALSMAQKSQELLRPVDHHMAQEVEDWCRALTGEDMSGKV